MALLDWIEAHTTAELETLVDAIEAGDIELETLGRLVELVEEAPLVQREEAVARTEVFDEETMRQRSVFNDLEAALDLEATAPPAPEPIVEDIDVLDPDRERAIDRIERLLQPSSERGFDFFDNFREAFETADPAPSAFLSQSDLDALTAEDIERFAERAARLAEQTAQQAASVEDFPRVRSAIRRGPGRGVSYFEAVLRELEGEASADRLPADELRQLRQSPTALEEAIEIVNENIDGLQNGPTERAARGEGEFPGPGRPDDVGEAGPVATTDYLTGEPVTRDPRFERKFIRLARDLGRARDLDLMPEPADYFELTPASQRRLYDVDPMEFMRRAISRGDVARAQLRSKYNFQPDEIPDGE